MAQDDINDTIEINSDNAILLLAAAQELGLDPGVVATTSDGVFSVPQEVVEKAGLGKSKRTAAKKATAKKAASTEKNSE
jgi:hypothetical protein